jgi:perosamine synthetase
VQTMTSSKRLAVLGGTPEITRSFDRYNPIGKEEAAAAQRVIESGVLSQFLGDWHEDFYGGPRIQEFERAWERHFKAAHAVTVNSNTSGLIAAIGAVGVEPGDEVIVSPWTMSASATSILVWNAIPVFADIEEHTFNLDPASIEARITPHTRAIMVTDIFGHAARLDEIMAIAKRHGLKVIEDAAQAPGALYRNRHVGTVADIGVFSLNYHKHIHTGEGGVCVSDDPALAERMQLIRNHAEAVVSAKGVNDLSNMIGFNFRMTEIEAAIGLEQLRKLERLVGERQMLADRLTRRLSAMIGLRTPIVEKACTHAYYVYPLVIDAAETGVHRDVIVNALAAEGVSVAAGYCNLHLMPMYQKRIAYGKHGFPWTGGIYKGSVSYERGICPVAESMNTDRYMCIPMCQYAYTPADIDLIGNAFEKVWSALPQLVGGASAAETARA